MAISDAQFEEWLRSDGKSRCIIMVIEHGIPSSPLYEYFSNFGFESGGNVYRDRIKGNVQYSASLNTQNFIGLGSASWSAIKLTNINGDLDYLADINYQGKKVEVKLGDQSWEESDFRPFVTAIAEQIVAPSKGTVEVRLLSVQYFLGNNINKNFYQPGELNAGNPHPFAWGTCFNISPVLVETGNANYPGGKWQCNTDTNGDPAYPEGVKNVFDDGIPLTRYVGALPVPAGQWQEYNETLLSPNTGQARGVLLGSSPAGVLTVDYHGEASVGGGADSARNTITRILQQQVPTTYGTSVVIPSNFGSPSSAEINFYSRELVTGLDLVSQLVTSVGATATFSKDADFILTVIDDSALIGGTPTLEIGTDDIIAGGFNLQSITGPSSKVSMNYFKNWTVQDQISASPAGFEDRTARLSQEFILREVDTFSNSAFARDAQTIDSLVHGHSMADDDNNSAQWGDELDLILASEIYNRERNAHAIYSLQVGAIGFNASPGELVNITHPRFGFESGRKALVLAVNLAMGQKSVVTLTIYTLANFDAGITSKTWYGQTSNGTGDNATNQTGADGVIGEQST